MDLPEDFGRRLRAARWYAGISRADLSQRLGWGSETTVQRVEDGLRELTAFEAEALLPKLAEACEVPQVFFTGNWADAGTTATARGDDLETPPWAREMRDRMEEMYEALRDSIATSDQQRGEIRGEVRQLGSSLQTLFEAAGSQGQAEGKRAPKRAHG